MPVIDSFAGQVAGLDSPVAQAAAVVPSDDTDLPQASRALYLGTGGDLRVTLLGGAVVTFRAAAAGWHPLRVARVHATGTGAADIVAGW
ncbi:spike base protein, RCAP_Rcc01079 family [Limimaricola pyoseonensis]|uniref:Uncharacterized protein n=1 Tax=Limimaricola pyoseonensis TaxID=521013 RepID=A0A1G7IW95_9RHOB|nr:hypothetical protein [Limimaricola pyoseonensis]SDF16856.1 hypothetical protein SAMN04488567_3547 [Limimaricola pyoseonensis]